MNTVRRRTGRYVLLAAAAGTLVQISGCGLSLLLQLFILGLSDLVTGSAFQVVQTLALNLLST